jgi:Protein of unknown function (DUF3237)
LLLQAHDLVCKSGELRRCFANPEEFTMHIVTRRAFGKLSTTIGAIALGFIVTLAGLAASAAESGNEARPAQDDKLQSEFLLDLTLEAQTPQNLGSAGGGRLIVPVSGGTFAGPRLKGTIIAPGGDWIVQRPDGSRILDVRILLQTDDGQKIYVSWRGIASTSPGGTLNARILPVFETAAAKYAWLNNVVAVGVYRPDLGKIAYRIYRIL